jgi:FkbM family methyltransferase
MLKILKSLIRKLIITLVQLLSKFSVGKYIYSLILNNAMNRVQKVSHESLSFYFSTPNVLNQYRADTFSTKEPETLEWIDHIPLNSVVWDIGANVGLYSCYAAKKRDCNVFAFEPSVFNLELLARNIYINNLNDKVTIVPLPLSDKLSVNNLNMTTTEWGGALSTFGQPYGHDGKEMNNKVFEFKTIGLSMLDAVNLLNIPSPDYIKMDVDGIEHLILKGGISVLENVKGILIEINDSFSTQANESKGYLEQLGFKLIEKTHAEEFDTGSAMYTFNQIWKK